MAVPTGAPVPTLFFDRETETGATLPHRTTLTVHPHLILSRAVARAAWAHAAEAVESARAALADALGAMDAARALGSGDFAPDGEAAAIEAEPPASAFLQTYGPRSTVNVFRGDD
ncbi:hypothetical protein B1759_10610 [Rubrivirga sp. SAORIC476]|uniref:hypothetical protein n=1 Tax=Rubrivirga sp. SAORIC476 TaxID=1961794 RepID=UPI000BA9B3D0|nr:hypothetical protein [Rubrivirga sp. SAORIC476]PAP81736.1 hypothetical protein B1759_10610 [Rubrivirga sp. SAORIC476]